MAPITSSRGSFAWLVLAALLAIEVAILVPVILAQKDKDQRRGAESVATFSTVLGLRAVRLLHQLGYTSRRTSGIGLLGETAREQRR